MSLRRFRQKNVCFKKIEERPDLLVVPQRGNRIDSGRAICRSQP